MTLVAAAGLLMGSVAYAPARAADLAAGGCCGDLEERVAELEATAARKGNRVVSLQVYGQVNKALMIWDDGHDKDAYVADNDYSGSRIGMIGTAKFKPGWTAGYNIELDIQDSASDKVSNGNDEGVTDEILIRYSNVYIESDTLGRITIGQQSVATDSITEIVLGNSDRVADIHHGNNFLIRVRAANDPQTNLRLRDIASDLDASRDDVIRYDSPSIYGFILSASWGDNDYADIGLRFKKEWNSIRIAGGIGYQWDSTKDATVFEDTTKFGSTQTLTGSISLMHIPTGIYGAFAAGKVELEDARPGPVDSADFWYVQLGLERKILPYGSTTFYGEYGQYNDMGALAVNTTARTNVNLGTTLLSSTEADRLGFGVVQRIDAAAMELYAQATFWDFDATRLNGTKVQLDDLSTVLIGSRIKF
jgi:predicted porin